MIKKPQKKDVERFFVDLLFIALGCLVGAFATVGIMIPNGLSSGGITGIVRILQNYLPFEFSIMYYLLALTIFVVCLALLGVREAKKILLLTFLYPAALFVLEQFPFELLEDKDIILAAIYCGVFQGICTGIVFSRGYSFGGTDTVAKIIQKKCLPHVSLSQILMIIDACVIVASGFVFGRNIALYALITTVIVSKAIDFVLYGFETKIVQVEVITEKYEEVSSYIMEELARGVSLETITGAYTKLPRQKLIALCSPRESVLIRKYVAGIDENALFTILQVNNIWGRGEGFGDIRKED